MTDLSVVDEAATWADLLVRREHRGPGDTIDAARQRANQAALSTGPTGF